MSTRYRSWQLVGLEDRSVPASVGGGYANAGLNSEYFVNSELAGSPSFTRHDVRLDFDWGTARSVGGSTSPAYAAIGLDQFSARFTGTLLPRFSEIYTFHTNADDGVRLSVRPEGSGNFTTIIERWSESGAFSGDYAFQAGSKYDIRVEYRELTGEARLQVEWASPSTPREVIESPGANGYNIDGRASFMLADAFRNARATWNGVSGGPAPGTDATGAPLGDGEMIVWEGAGDFYFSGTYAARFTGQATISGTPGGTFNIRYRIPGNPTLFDSLTPVQIWNAATNTSTFEIVVPNHAQNSPFTLRLQNTRRVPTDVTPTGVNNIEIMRPQTVGGNDPYAFGTLFRDNFKTAAGVFTHFRWLDVNGDLTESEWSQRVTPVFGRAARPNNTTVIHKGWMYEYQIQFANEMGKDLYITTPMRASNDYYLQLANLIRYGSRADGTVCTTDDDPLRVHAGLNPNLKAYIEVANEVWNGSGPFGQTRQADDDAVAAGLAAPGSAARAEWDIINYDGALNTTDTGGYGTFNMQRLTRWYALRTIRMSEQFRAVFAEEMLERARPLLYWQYNNANNTTLNELKFLDDYFNNSAGNFNAIPRPIKYFIWGAGGASYFSSSNAQGRLAVDPIGNSSFDITQGLPFNAATVRPNSVTDWSFLGNAGVYGRAPTAPATFTSEGRTLAGVANPAVGDYAAYLLRELGNGQASTISRVIRFNEPGRYAIGFLLRYRSGFQYNVPLDFHLDGQRVTPRYLPFRGVGETDAAAGPLRVAFSFNINPEAVWSGQLTTATLQIDVPQGGRDVTFAISAANVTALPGAGDYQSQLDSYALFDGFYVGSVDRLFEAGLPSTGEANGQVGTGNYTRDREQIAQYAQAYGLVPASYESGWSLGGDGGSSPLQNWAKYRDARAKVANDLAIDVHDHAGYGLVSQGVYEQWRDYDLTNAATAPLRQSFAGKNEELRSEASNGWHVPLVIRPFQQSLGYTGSGINWGFTRTADASLSAGEFLTWNIIVPATGNYSINAVSTGGTARLLLDEAEITSGTHTLTAGLHTLKLRSIAGAVVVDRVDVTAVNAPAAPTLTSAIDADSSVTLAWSPAPGATGYRIRFGTAPNDYDRTIDVGSATEFTVNGLTNNQQYFFAVSAANAWGLSLPSNERGVTPIGEGAISNLAIWEFTGSPNGGVTAPPTSATGRVVVGPLSRGPGMIPGATFVVQFFPNRFSSFSSNNNWAQTLDASIAQGQYNQFSIAASPGNVASLTSLGFTATFTNLEADCAAGLLYSTDGINFTSIPVSGTPNAAAGYTADLSGIPALQNNAGTVTFRIHLFGAPSFSGTAIGLGTAANDLSVIGDVKAIPTVAAVIVEDGVQRSMVNELTVRFNTLVTLGSAPFEVRLQGGGPAIPLTFSTADANGRTLATINLIGASLADGRYTLTTPASQVTHRSGGVGQSADHAFDFHRLFGDADGNGTVDGSDFAAFGNAFGSTVPASPFDFDNNGTIDGSDLAQFGNRFGVTL